MSFADAINAAVLTDIQRLRDYGGLLAQANMPLPDDLGANDRPHVQQGYDEQIEDFPQG